MFRIFYAINNILTRHFFVCVYGIKLHENEVFGILSGKIYVSRTPMSCTYKPEMMTLDRFFIEIHRNTKMILFCSHNFDYRRLLKAISSE